MHNLLFDRPIGVDSALAPMTVTGSLANYTSGEAYSSFLTVNDRVGKCVVEVLESSLPPGTAVRIDNILGRVVVSWAAYVVVEDTTKLVPNGGFEAGNDGNWSLGQGWSIGTGTEYPTKTGVHSARFADVKTKGSNLVMVPLPARVNDVIKLTAQVRHGGSSSGNAGARVWLLYHDADGRELSNTPGSLVSSGKKDEWKETAVSAAAPQATATATAVVAAYRNKQNEALWVDDVSWNHAYVVGQKTEETYSLHIRVRDSLNRVAEWSGLIKPQLINPVAASLWAKLVSWWELAEPWNGLDQRDIAGGPVRVDSHTNNHLNTVDRYGRVSPREPSYAGLLPIPGAGFCANPAGSASRAGSLCVGLDSATHEVASWQFSVAPVGGATRSIASKGSLSAGRGWLAHFMSGSGTPIAWGLTNTRIWPGGTKNMDFPSGKWFLAFASRDNTGGYMAVDSSPDVRTDSSPVLSATADPFGLGNMDGYGQGHDRNAAGTTAYFNARLTGPERAYLYNGGIGVTYAKLKFDSGNTK